MVLGGWAAPLDLQAQVAWPTQQVDTVRTVWPGPGRLLPFLGLSA